MCILLYNWANKMMMMIIIITLQSGGVLAWLSVWSDMQTCILLPLTVSCFSKIQIGFAFLVPAHLGSPGRRVRYTCVCVCRVYRWHLIVCTVCCRILVSRSVAQCCCFSPNKPTLVFAGMVSTTSCNAVYSCLLPVLLLWLLVLYWAICESKIE